MSQILICYGTRPEWLKIKPLLEQLKINKIKFKTLFTGQHVDMVENTADYAYAICDNVTNRLNAIISSTVVMPDYIFTDVTSVLVQGDTSTALGISINAFNRNIRLIHLEAGLRTYDKQNPYPEEINRQLIGRIADIHFCPTKLNKVNLKNEHCKGKIFVVGNTSIDNIVNVKTSYNNNILVTIHRRENHSIIESWFREISKLALRYTDLNFILPIHPNPEVQKYKHLLKGVNVIAPLCHSDLIKTLSTCKLVITDSGGIQEEACFLKKKVIVCRKVTERTESLNTHSFMCRTPSQLCKIFKNNLKNYIPNGICPYGTGNTAKSIVKILIREKICCS